MRSRRLVTLALAIVVWWLVGLPILAPLVATFLAVWFLAAVFARERFVPSTTTALLALVGAAAFAGYTRGADVVATEQLAGLDVVLADRWRLTKTPAIAPPVLHLDRPSVLFGHADAASMALVFDDTTLPGAPLGHGLFAFDFDPGAHRVTRSVRLEVDGDREVAALDIVSPRHEPRWGCAGATVAVVSEPTDTLFVRDGGAWRAEPTLDGPAACVVLDDGRIVVAHRYDPRLRVGTGEIEIGVGQVGLARRGDRIAVASIEPPSVTIVDVTTSSIVERIPLAAPPDWVTYAGERLLVASRTAHTLARVGHDDALYFGRPAIHLTSSPSGRLAFVALTDYRPDGDAGPNHHVNEQIVVVDVDAWRIVERIETGAFGALPTGIHAPDDDMLLVSFAASNALVTIDVKHRAARAKVDLPIVVPHAVLHANDDTFVVSPAEAAIHHVEADRTERFEAEPARGYRAFYEATRAGVACATCHLHATTDFAFHDIGHGEPRSTLDVRGTWGTAPYLRGASYPTIGALHDFAEGVLGGYEREVADRPARLEAFLKTRGRERARPVVPEAAGVDAFVRADCVACHAFPAFTNLAQLPEASLFPDRRDLNVLDTPSLLGLRDSAPYLLDGRAKTIDAVLFDHDPAERHGSIARLDEAGRRALLAFLEAL
ncbi:MAG: hypothetical protein RMA76_06705 [Deltaproteobacteria bacterium]